MVGNFVAHPDNGDNMDVTMSSSHGRSDDMKPGIVGSSGLD
jgi:hypothetical protein